MPKATSRKRAAASNEYDSDGGFVEDAPKSKKPKASSSNGNTTGVHKDEEGCDFWELSRTRRVQISEFKGNTMVNIREFYEKDDKMLPGKKGISLTLDQYKVLIEAMPEIEASLKGKGATVPRPQYDGIASKAEVDEEEDVKSIEDAKPATKDVDDNEEIPKPSKGRLHRFKLSRGNHEATSDEDN